MSTSWYKKFGFWNDDELKLESWIAPSWGPADRIDLIEYVKRSPVVMAGSAPNYACEICRKSLPAAEYQSDGEWFWPLGLGHYLEEHQVRLPDDFVARIRAQGHRAPLQVDFDFFRTE